MKAYLEREISHALNTLVIATVRAVEQVTKILRYFSASNTCTCPQAVDDFAALANGSLATDGLLRLSRHTSECPSCRVLLATLVMATGLRRVIRTGLQDLGKNSRRRGPAQA